MVKVREEHPLLKDGRLDINAWVEQFKDEQQWSDLDQVIRALKLAQELAPIKTDESASILNSLDMGLEMVQILIGLRLDQTSIVAAILYRCVREEKISLELIEQQFGEEVAKLIKGVLRMAAISKIRNESDYTKLLKQKNQVDNIRKMLVAMIDDVRVALIKLAERTVAIRGVKDGTERQKRKVALEVFNIYAPLAHRLGIGHLKWELEDLAFRYLEPDAYKKIASLLDEKRLARQAYIKDLTKRIQTSMSSAGIEADISGRAKHIYSIWRKMKRKNISFSEVYDIRAVRILVNKLSDCYTALGIVHSLWRNVPNEFDDYIANPKENGYQSLHTAVVGPEGKVIEIQIRTHDMHADAEFGVCAHWLYKGTDIEHKDRSYEDKISWLRQVLEWHDELGDISQIVQDLREDFTPDRIYVFTPDGHVMDLPPKATPLDFAYRVHTEIGHRCRGAKVNGRIVPLTYLLNTAEQVEILTHKQAQPSRNWLARGAGYIYTARARAKVMHWFKVQDRDKNIDEGRQLLHKELQKLALNEPPLKDIALRMNVKTVEDLYAAIGAGDLRLGQVIHAILKQTGEDSPSFELQKGLPFDKEQKDKPSKQEDIHVLGVGNLLTHLAPCCQPNSNDAITGFVTLGRGVQIHKSDCENIQNLQSQHPERIVQVSWGKKPEHLYVLELQIEAFDRHGLIRDISQVLSKESADILALNTRSNKEDNSTNINISCEIKSIQKVSELMDTLLELPNITSVQRVKH